MSHSEGKPIELWREAGEFNRASSQLISESRAKNEAGERGGSTALRMYMNGSKVKVQQLI